MVALHTEEQGVHAIVTCMQVVGEGSTTVARMLCHDTTESLHAECGKWWRLTQRQVGVCVWAGEWRMHSRMCVVQASGAAACSSKSSAVSTPQPKPKRQEPKPEHQEPKPKRREPNPPATPKPGHPRGRGQAANGGAGPVAPTGVSGCKVVGRCSSVRVLVAHCCMSMRGSCLCAGPVVPGWVSTLGSGDLQAGSGRGGHAELEI